MKDNHFKRFRIRLILAAILSAVLLGACAVQKTPKSIPESETYEQYRADDAAAQAQFNLLAETLFREEISKSNLDLHYTCLLYTSPSPRDRG